MSASLSRLQNFYGELKPSLLLHAMIKREFPGTIALLTSFAGDAGLLLFMVAEIDPATPVLVSGGGTLPSESLHYGRMLCNRLGLSRLIVPEPGALADILDELGILALITARTGTRLPRIGLDEHGVFRIHPLAHWLTQDHENELSRRNIPAHPLGTGAGLESAAFAGEAEPMDTPTSLALDWHL